MKKHRDEFITRAKKAEKEILDDVDAMMEKMSKIENNMQLTRDEKKSAVSFSNAFFLSKNLHSHQKYTLKSNALLQSTVNKIKILCFQVISLFSSYPRPVSKIVKIVKAEALKKAMSYRPSSTEGAPMETGFTTTP